MREAWRRGSGMLCLKVMGELIMIFFNVSQAVEIEIECFQAD
jgi:hypothetical protein